MKLLKFLMGDSKNKVTPYNLDDKIVLSKKEQKEYDAMQKKITPAEEKRMSAIREGHHK
jgi:hypothetical protein